MSHGFQSGGGLNPKRRLLRMRAVSARFRLSLSARKKWAGHDYILPGDKDTDGLGIPGRVSFPVGCIQKDSRGMYLLY